GGNREKESEIRQDQQDRSDRGARRDRNSQLGGGTPEEPEKTSRLLMDLRIGGREHGNPGDRKGKQLNQTQHRDARQGAHGDRERPKRTKSGSRQTGGRQDDERCDLQEHVSARAGRAAPQGVMGRADPGEKGKEGGET